MVIFILVLLILSIIIGIVYTAMHQYATYQLLQTQEEIEQLVQPYTFVVFNTFAHKNERITFAVSCTIEGALSGRKMLYLVQQLRAGKIEANTIYNICQKQKQSRS